MDGEAREARRRLMIAAGAVVAVLAVTFGLLFVLRDPDASKRISSGRSGSPSTSIAVTSTTEPADAPANAERSIDPSVFAMPRTESVLDFGKAYAVALSTWDSTTQSLKMRRELLLAWTPPTGWWTDAESMLDDWLGDQETWDAARRAKMAQTVKVNRVWIPASLKEWTRTHPKEWAAQNWVVGVNVNMTLMVRGVPGASQDRPSTVTVLVACPPGDDCVGLAPGRSVVDD